MLGIRPRPCVGALALVTVATLTVFAGTLTLAVAGAAAATVRTCQGGGVSYRVTVPQNAGSTAGADPFETRASNCTIGYQEKKGFPLSLIGVCLIFTAASLVLLYRKKGILDLPDVGRTAFNVTGGDA